MIGSMVCRREHFDTSWYKTFADLLPLRDYGIEAGGSPARPHRKAWEWCAISQALEERGMLAPGRTGVGFAVGKEPLPSFFASRGVEVLATDQAATAEAAAWSTTNQHAASLEAIFLPKLVDRATFDMKVRFRPADMRRLDLPWDQQYDFLWSSCSFEHLGSLQKGLDFLVGSAKLLKPGGVAVHTTEFNVASNEDTVETGDSVIYRKKDIEQIDRILRRTGCGMARCDFFSGDHPDDLNFDTPPYGTTARQHLKLLLHGYIATSMIIVITKGGMSARS